MNSILFTLQFHQQFILLILRLSARSMSDWLLHPIMKTRATMVGHPSCQLSFLETAERFWEAPKVARSSFMIWCRIELLPQLGEHMMMKLTRCAGQIERQVIFYTRDQMTVLSKCGTGEPLVQAQGQQVCSLAIKREWLMLQAKVMVYIWLLTEKINFLKYGISVRW